MPVYDFECKKCGKKFEESVSLKEFDTKKITCEDKTCNGDCERQLPLIEKGSSWGHWKL